MLCARPGSVVVVRAAGVVAENGPLAWTAVAHAHRIPVRYGEVDMQGVVFNAHYLAYCDDACDSWFRHRLGHYEDLGWEPMVVKAVVEWQGGAGIGDTLDITLQASRWGNSSFDVSFVGVVGARPVFTATITYVGVTTSEHKPMPMPDDVRAALS